MEPDAPTLARISNTAAGWIYGSVEMWIPAPVPPVT
jgi:hypothetical protein